MREIKVKMFLIKFKGISYLQKICTHRFLYKHGLSYSLKLGVLLRFWASSHFSKIMRQKKSFSFVTLRDLKPHYFLICYTNSLISLKRLKTSATNNLAPAFRTRLASTRKSGKFVPIRLKLNTPTSIVSLSRGTSAMSV